MKIKINQNLTGLDGEPLKGDKGRVLTLRDVFINSVLTPIDGDDDRKKYEKWEIFKKVRDAKEEADLTVEDIAVLKKSIGKIQPPLILGQCFDMIEGK